MGGAAPPIGPRRAPLISALCYKDYVFPDWENRSTFLQLCYSMCYGYFQIHITCATFINIHNSQQLGIVDTCGFSIIGLTYKTNLFFEKAVLSVTTGQWSLPPTRCWTLRWQSGRCGTGGCARVRVISQSEARDWDAWLAPRPATCVNRATRNHGRPPSARRTRI